ncbi:MAG: hypothetical protein KME38_01930 [Spirirestis rafaelensis WJT71-NPBG6]|jgi:hypothetical protein|nr:hypothetical protein [Spirirestis rafaelensis WJT71-NPBG6]
MNQAEPEFCFCTIAFGKKYRALALLLAQDIERYSPKTSFIVLTDNPSDFNKQPNILAFKHRSQSVKFYHDKRFAIAKALSLFNSCIFIDADMRILAPVPADMQWIKKPGIAARTCEIMPKKYAKVLAGTATAKLGREFKVTKKAAQKLNLDLENEKVKFVYEYLFAVTKDFGRELEFLKQWETLANYFELNGIYDGEGNAIGLAAAKAGLDVRLSEMEGISFFKDKTELVRIQKGQSKIEEMSIYFEQQKMLEYPKRSLLEKVAAKLGQSITHLYNLVRLRIVTLSKFNFYYR